MPEGPAVATATLPDAHERAEEDEGGNGGADADEPDLPARPLAGS